MFTVIAGAVRSRTAQALMVAVLAALPATAAAAAPWYGLAAGSAAAGAQVDAAPAAQRVLSASRPGSVGGDPRAALTGFAASVRTLLPIAGATPVLGLRQELTVARGPAAASTAAFAAAYRDGFCEHVRLTGACPAAAGEAAVSRDAARRIPLKVGDEFRVRPAGSAAGPARFRVVGLYDPADPGDAWWADTLFSANGQLDPFFTTLDSFRRPQLAQPTLAWDVDVPARLLRGDDGYDLAAVVGAAVPGSRAAGITLTDRTGPLLAAVYRERVALARGILIALGQLMALGWFAIALAGRYTSRDRSGDAGLLKLRGGTRSAVLRLGLGQHAVALLAAAAVALPAGFAAGPLLAGRLPVSSELRLAILLSAAAAGLVAAGGLAVLAAVDAVPLRLPVAVLLRRVGAPARGRRWAAVAEAAVLTVTAFAVYQARAGGPDSGLAVIAPALVALAFALLSARLLRRLADAAGGVALRRGRLRLGLAAVRVSRQPGTDRVFALIVVAVAMFAVAVGGYAAGRTARATRAAADLGAARVLTVRADSRTQLLYAVRTADPGGRHAMAVVVDQSSNPPVLAVDAARLAAVALWRPEYGPVSALTGAGARPPALPLITGTALTLDAGGDRPVAAPLYATLQNEATGAVVQAVFPGVGTGDRTVTARIAGCTTGPGCRLVRWQLVTPAGPDGNPVGGAVTVRGLSQRDPPARILGAAELSDPAHWYTDFTGIAVRAGTRGGILSMAAQHRGTLVAGDKVYAAYAPLPLPLVLAGPRPQDWTFTDASSFRFGPGRTPVRVAGTARILPVLGAAGVLVDLDATRLIAADAEPGGTYQVWLTRDAPASVVAALHTAGLTVVADDSAAARTAALARHARIVAARFALFTVAVGLLLAAAMVAVAGTVERRPAAEHLLALRVQGLARPAAVAAGAAGTAALVLSGLLGGLLAAGLARRVAGLAAPPFDDGWRVLPPPGALGGPALALTAVVALVVLAVTGWLAVLPLTRRLRGGAR